MRVKKTIALAQPHLLKIIVKIKIRKVCKPVADYAPIEN